MVEPELVGRQTLVCYSSSGIYLRRFRCQARLGQHLAIFVHSRMFIRMFCTPASSTILVVSLHAYAPFERRRQLGLRKGWVAVHSPHQCFWLLWFLTLVDCIGNVGSAQASNRIWATQHFRVGGARPKALHKHKVSIHQVLRSASFCATYVRACFLSACCSAVAPLALERHHVAKDAPLGCCPSKVSINHSPTTFPQRLFGAGVSYKDLFLKKVLEF